ncbi:MAG: DUF1343 domain-containing protein [Bacteroidales bacterium]|nr:DUF1343 domain-containing protein [Bacteroidales bacterium]
MFSFRTTPLLEQEDFVLRRRPIAVLDDCTAWHPNYGEYLADTLARYRNVTKVTGLKLGNIPPECRALVIEHQDTGNRFDPFLKELRDFFLDLNRSEDPISIYIIDRFNPSGRQVEGVHHDGIPHKHGLTIGEIANMFYTEIGAHFPLHIISANANDAGRELMPWSIPQECGFGTLFSSVFMSGGYLWKGTNVSCGEGTLRPYEMFGAPFMKNLVTSGDFAWGDALTWNDVDSPLYNRSVWLRQCEFIPQYGLYEGEKCYGFQLLPNPAEHNYNSLLHTLKLISFVRSACPEFRFNSKMGALAADERIESYLKGETDYETLRTHLRTEEQKWLRKAKKYLLYDEQLYRIK